jgi:hypothetical protein
LFALAFSTFNLSNTLSVSSVAFFNSSDFSFNSIFNSSTCLVASANFFNPFVFDWFLPWPEEALIAVAASFLGKYEMDTPLETKESLFSHMGKIHDMVNTMTGT